MTTVNASIQGLLGLLQLGPRVRSAAGVEELGFIAVPEPRSVDVLALPPRLAEEWASGRPAHALAVPLPHAGAGPQGVLLLAREQAWREEELALAGEVGAVLGHGLFALRPRERWWRALLTRLRTRQA